MKAVIRAALAAATGMLLVVRVVNQSKGWSDAGPRRR